LKILELFCGRGGWSKGFKEIFPDAEFTGIDITNFSEFYPFEFLQKDLMDYTPEPIYDIILASPPCSEFSEVKRNCAHPYDERQGLDLVWRTYYLISVLKPRYWIIENVKGLAEFLPPQNQKIQYGLKTRKTAYLWSNANIELGFFDYDMSDYNSQLWHNPKFRHLKLKGGAGEIPLELSRQMAKKMKEKL